MKKEQPANPYSHRDADDPIDTADRRLCERRPPVVEPTFVWVSMDRRIQGRLVDESDGGIGLLVNEIASLEIGFQVRVELDEVRRTASVVYINQLEPNLYRLGLLWE